ncbi:MAG: FtsW/RodA/SpoVE family cell cycle protein [Microscillaceae bacterium]|jgi:cell division protein FtsW|nr:FtsW/RodA/SpoVE family cell cycle protein [Microscillaceae bacterium]
MSDETLGNITRPSELEFEKSSFSTWFNRHLKGDQVIWLIIIALSILSILVVYSATGTLAFKEDLKNQQGNYLLRHAFNVFLALLAVWACHRIDYRYFSRISRIALLLSVPLLLIAWLFGTSLNEANRWITIPFIKVTFQPSDFAKLALIAGIASMLSRRQSKVHEFEETVLPILIWTGIICTLIGLANISNAILLFSTSLLLMFIGRVPVQHLLMLVLVGIVSLMLSLYLGQRMGTFQSRIDKYMNTEEVAFQAEQSYIAISNGGLIGRGPGRSIQRNFLPNPYSDFVFAIILEEYGLLGGAVVMGLYLLLLYRGMMVVATSSQPFGGILAAGLTFSLVLQAVLNMCVAVGLTPITGVPLPLLSMGGTSLLFTGIALGIIISISRGEVDKDIETIKVTTENTFRN